MHFLVEHLRCHNKCFFPTTASARALSLDGEAAWRSTKRVLH